MANGKPNMKIDILKKISMAERLFGFNNVAVLRKPDGSVDCLLIKDSGDAENVKQLFELTLVQFWKHWGGSDSDPECRVSTENDFLGVRVY